MNARRGGRVKKIVAMLARHPSARNREPESIKEKEAVQSTASL
jgi:hypothetical protein